MRGRLNDSKSAEVGLRPDQQGCKDHGHGEEGKSYDENCHCSDPLQAPTPPSDPPGAAAVRLLLLESPLELLSGAHEIPPTGHGTPLYLRASYPRTGARCPEMPRETSTSYSSKLAKMLAFLFLRGSGIRSSAGALSK